MSDGGHPAVGADEASDSPLPAGYGSLDAGFPGAGTEPLERRRSRSANGAGADGRRSAGAGAGSAGAGAGAGAGGAGAGGARGTGSPPAPVRPSARRPPRSPEAPPAPGGVSPGGVSPASALPGGPGLPAAPASPLAPAERGETGPRRAGDADVVEGPVRGSRRPHQKVRVVRGVRSKRLVRRVDVWTVAKVSFVFYLLALLVLLVAGVIMWNVASAFGFVHSIEKSIRTLFSLKTFTLHPASTLEYGAAIGGVLCLLGLIVNVLAAVTYNLVSDLVGGVQVVVVSEPD